MKIASHEVDVTAQIIEWEDGKEVAIRVERVTSMARLCDLFVEHVGPSSAIDWVKVNGKMSWRRNK